MKAAVISGQRGHEHADAGQGVLAQDHGADDRADAGGQEGAPPHRQPGQCLTHVGPPVLVARPAQAEAPSGTGTVAMIPSRIAVVLRPVIAASTLGSSRCASTGRARSWTSSGSTKSRPAIAATALDGADQVQRGARGGAQHQLTRAPGRGGQRDGVALHGRGDVDLADDADQLADLRGVGHRLEVLERVVQRVRVEHRDLGGLDRVAHRHPRHEAVALGLGEGVGALHLDGVLRRDDHERRLELVRRPVDGDLTLLHALQQRGLGLGGGAVDLVADDDVGEDAAGAELELAGVLVEHRDAGDVGGQQVRV